VPLIVRFGDGQAAGTVRRDLVEHIEANNLIAGMYAIRALERVGDDAKAALPAIRDARDSKYEFTRRFARRLTRNLSE